MIRLTNFLTACLLCTSISFSTILLAQDLRDVGDAELVTLLSGKTATDVEGKYIDVFHADGRLSGRYVSGKSYEDGRWSVDGDRLCIKNKDDYCVRVMTAGSDATESLIVYFNLRRKEIGRARLAATPN